MSVNHERRSLRTSGGGSRDLFGAEFLGSPCHHRVLKPPGGGTSDIFGGTEPSEKLIVRKKSVQTSNIILNDEPTTNGNGVTSALHNGHAKQSNCNARLFGPPSEGNGNTSNGAGHHSKTNGEVTTNGIDRTDAPTPPTTPAKSAMANGKVTNGEMKNGVIAAAACASPARGRVPPGGYSSGLW